MHPKHIAWLGGLMLVVLVGWSSVSWAQDVAPQTEEAAALTLEDVQRHSEEVGWALTNVWLLICGALVFIMQLGFGSLESGFLPQKHTVNVLMKNTMDFAMGAIVFFLIGFSIMYGEGGGWIGWAGFGIEGFAPAEGETFASAGEDYSHYANWFFQVVFAAAAATIASGAMGGRTAFRSYLICTILITGLIYPISGHWTWGGGWLDQMGFADFAGSMIVHGCGGFIALAGALVLGPRIGRFVNGKSRPIPGHSMPMAFVGAMLLFFGWFGFNAGSVLETLGGLHGDEFGGSAVALGLVCMTTLLSAAAGAVAAMFTIWAISGKPDLGMALNGILAGLVGITANADQVTPGSAILIGLVAGVIVCMGTIALDKLRIDDPVGAFPVHGLCGVWGCIACGIFGSAIPDDMTRGGYIFTQVVGTLAIAVWAFAASFVLFSLVRMAIGLRTTDGEELEGLDLTEHGSEAYPDYSLRIR